MFNFIIIIYIVKLNEIPNAINNSIDKYNHNVDYIKLFVFQFQFEVNLHQFY